MTVSDDSTKEEILAALRAFHGGKIYLMGAPGLVTAGFELHNEHEVASIEWAKNFSCLHVRIGQAGRVVVNVRLKEGRPAFSCTCSRGSRDLGCEHAVCAVLTLKNLLIPEVFKPKKTDPAYRRALLAGLIGVPPESLKKKNSGYAIVLEREADEEPDVFITQDGTRVTKLADLLPTPLTDFAAPDLRSPQKIDALRRFLKLHGNAYPIIVRIAREDHAARFDPEPPFEPYTSFEISGDEVVVVRGLRDQEKKSVAFFPFEDLVYLPGAQKIAVSEMTGGWDEWELFRSAISETSPRRTPSGREQLRLTFSCARFNVLQYNRAREGRRNGNGAICLTQNGTEVKPVPAVFEFRLTIALSGEGGGPAARMRARSLCRSGQTRMRRLFPGPSA